MVCVLTINTLVAGILGNLHFTLWINVLDSCTEKKISSESSYDTVRDLRVSAFKSAPCSGKFSDCVLR